MRTYHTIHVALLLTCISVAYGIFQARELIQGPRLVVSAPTDGATLGDRLMAVEGTVHNATEVRVNGRAVATDTSGNFRELFAVPQGIGSILVEAHDRFGRTTEEALLVYGTPAGGVSR